MACGTLGQYITPYLLCDLGVLLDLQHREQAAPTSTEQESQRLDQQKQHQESSGVAGAPTWTPSTLSNTWLCSQAVLSPPPHLHHCKLAAGLLPVTYVARRAAMLLEKAAAWPRAVCLWAPSPRLPRIRCQIKAYQEAVKGLRHPPTSSAGRQAATPYPRARS